METTGGSRDEDDGWTEDEDDRQTAEVADSPYRATSRTH
jgi:hypothetical protein